MQLWIEYREREKVENKAIRGIRGKERKKDAPGLILRGVFLGGWYETSYIIRVLERYREKK